MLVAWQRAKGPRQELNLRPYLVGCSNLWATGTPGEPGRLSWFLYKVSRKKDDMLIAWQRAKRNVILVSTT